MRLIDIIATANANLRRSKLRTFLTISAVFMGAFTLMLTTGIGAGLKAYVADQVNAVGAKDVLFIQAVQDNTGPFQKGQPKEYDPNSTQSNSAFGLGKLLQQSDIQKIKQTPGIKLVDPLYPATAEYITAGQKKYVAGLTQAVRGMTQPLKAGRDVSEDRAGYEVTLPPQLVGPLGFRDNQAALGQTIRLGFKSSNGAVFELTAKVAGVQEKTLINGNQVTANIVMMHDAYQKMTAGIPRYQAQAYEAVFAKFDSSLTKAQLDSLKHRLKDQKYQASTLQDQLGIINSVINGITTFLTIFAAIVLAAASFGIINTLLMAVQERTREIGLMKALGMGRARIFGLFSLEAVLIGFWGSLIALGVANIAGRIASRIAARTIFKDFEGLHLFSFPALSMTKIVLLIMLIAFLAATIPARRASRLNPIDALRYE